MITNNNLSQGVNETAPGSVAQAQASAVPAPPNEGGISASPQFAEYSSEGTHVPRLVTRGESSYTEITAEDGESYVLVVQNNRPKLIHIPKPKSDGNPNAAIVDYLNCTFDFSNLSLDSFFGDLLRVLGKSFAPAADRQRGLHGYKHSFQLGKYSALFAYGGNAGTGWLSFSGEACHVVSDWPGLVDHLQNNLKAQITRWDGAYDDFNGVHTVDHALRMYKEGLFTSGGRKPRMDQRGNWEEPDGRGRTLYIGSSENGKLARIYEKGMQQGIPFHPWVRWEVQMGNVDRIIPWEAVLEPGKYLAGTYKDALDWISTEQCRIRTLKKVSSLNYDSLTHWLSVAYGKHINVMMQKEGSAESVINKIIRSGIPSRLDLPELPNYGKVLP